MNAREERIRRDMQAEIMEYIDGDAENGPRYGVEIDEEEFEKEVHRRMMCTCPFDDAPEHLEDCPALDADEFPEVPA